MITLAMAAILCDGVTDDRPAIQAALDVGSVVLPAGVCLVSAAPLRNYALTVPAGATLRGAGRDATTLLLAGGAPLSTQILWIDGAADVTLQALALDGQRSLQSAPGAAGPQRHGAFVRGSPRFSARSVTSQHNAGDGIYIYAGSDHASLVDVTCSDNDRDGVTLGGVTEYTSAVSSEFSRNGQDGWHSEGGGRNNNVMLVGDTFVGNAGFALTMSGIGADPAVHNHGWTVVDNEVYGPVAIVWVDDVLFARNRVINSNNQTSVLVYRQLDRVRIEDNDITATGQVVNDSISVIDILGTNLGQSPGGVIVARNRITTMHPQFGVSATCARDVQILDNVITGSPEGLGPHSSGAAGIFVRTTRTEEPVRSVVVRGNVVSGFGAYGLMLGGNGSAVIQHVLIEDNAFTGTSQLFAMSLNDGLNEALDVIQERNTSSTMLVTNQPGWPATQLGDGTRWSAP
jgi:hypothetical protein